MPQDPLVWIVLILAAAAVIGLAVWKGRGLRVRRGEEGISIEVERAHEPAADGGTRSEGGGISVAKGARIEGARVGDVAGIKSTGARPPENRDVDVASGARIKDSEVGDIVGVKHGGRDSEDDR